MMKTICFQLKRFQENYNVCICDLAAQMEILTKVYD